MSARLLSSTGEIFAVLNGGARRLLCRLGLANRKRTTSKNTLVFNILKDRFMTSLRVSVVQWPEGLFTGSRDWGNVSQQIMQSPTDILVTNEMPFGTWIASTPEFNVEQAQKSVQAHEDGLKALHALHIPLIISSRPVWVGDGLANEAFAIENGIYRTLHQKHYFPEEPGWYESTWFRTGIEGFEVTELCGVKVGVLLCTELMFNERARAYGRANADLIVVPRATGQALESWRAACAMAALVSGSYVVSSNRVGASKETPLFGGHGFAYAPGGTLLVETSDQHPMEMIALDLQATAAQKREYPCYVPEYVQHPENN